ncbi:amidohydrolase family protein [Solirubrobacter ginsenosidimutans]|uniref:Amidohydrolase family protein n=1 Tax=Solirubrobacter ginsenosidimutans TaxID=490573 RepID=A0A9X3MS27_9ACTN|nr:amidohydrolase family protein [Solirubrobacter ginsenosidimutans]MDA0160871.1 amidohydrolase family protein [Solirubrobacter ginsenosidimutans]
MIVDCHCHAGIGDGLTGPWDTEAHLGRYLARAARAGIERTVVFPAFHSDYALANRAVARIVARSRGRLYGFAFVHPVRDAGRVHPMVREAVEEHDFRGIKVHRHDGRITREICEAARRFRLPVLYDVMGEVETAELLAGEYPDVAFIIPHLGSFADEWRAQVAMIGLLIRHRNVHTDTSAVRRFDLLAEAVRRRPRQVLFGSDGPWLHPGLELAKIELLGLRPADERRVLSTNVLRLIEPVQRTRTVSRKVFAGFDFPGPKYSSRSVVRPDALPV